VKIKHIDVDDADVSFELVIKASFFFVFHVLTAIRGQ